MRQGKGATRLKKPLYVAGFALALAFFALTFVNASWLADDPKGAPKMIAHRGLHQLYDHTDVTRDTCTATRIETPYHAYLENTQDGIVRAAKMGAAMVEVDIAPTIDGEIALFHDWTLDCRTNGTGDTRKATMEQLKALDAGYGYSADGGETFPFRGQGIGKIPQLEDVLAALPKRARLMFNFKSKDPAEADLLAAKLKAAGRDPIASRDGFYGDETVVSRITAHFPESWSWSKQGARKCSSDYVAYGWSGYLPESCRGETMIIPLDRQFAFWGWPNRLIARMEEYGGRIIITGPDDDDKASGLTLPEQLGEIPASANTYIWVEDSFAIVPALIQRFDDRTEAEFDATEAALKQRRSQ